MAAARTDRALWVRDRWDALGTCLREKEGARIYLYLEAFAAWLPELAWESGWAWRGAEYGVDYPGFPGQRRAATDGSAERY